MKVLSVPYKSLDNSSLGILCLDSCIFRLAIGEKMCSQPMSIDFYMLLLFEAEAGFHAVDLVSYKVSRGTLLMVRPGQVQQWDNQNWPRATMLAIRSSFLPNRSEPLGRSLPVEPMGTWPAHLDLGEAQYELVSNSLAEIKLEVLAARDDPSSTSLLLHLLFVLLIRMGRMDELVPPLAHRAVEQENIYRGFRRDIETHYKESRQARDYASRLGCSGRTLSRAVKSASGMTPKQVIDERIALEAKRLLIYTAWPLKRVALELGFAGSANFIRFFHRTAGFTPEQFRTTYAHRLTTDAEDQARVSARSDPTP